MKDRLRNRFRLLIVSQVLFLTAALAVLVTVLSNTSHVAVPVLLGLAVFVQVIVLLRSVQRHVDSLEEFFAAVNYEDFTRRFVEDDVDAELKDAFNRVLHRFQDARRDRDLQASYLDTVIRHVPVPLIAARSDGTIALINNPARRLTGLQTLSRLDDLASIDAKLPAALLAIDSGQTRLLQTAIRDVPVELRVSVAEIRMAGDVERLYSIENLSGELSARESSAWRNLIRVLTHEIMNTLTPVTSLAHTASEMLDASEVSQDIRDAVATIGRRSDGMIRFVSRYRELLQVPKPNVEKLDVLDLLENVARLMRAQHPTIRFHVCVEPESLCVHADKQLLEQVLINLVKNSADALGDTGQPKVELTADLEPGRTVLAVRDNGSGISSDDLDQVFIPFFTTKRDGSGIGLSLSRQIMTSHGGDLLIDSSDDGTHVRLLFK